MEIEATASRRSPCPLPLALCSPSLSHWPSITQLISFPRRSCPLPLAGWLRGVGARTPTSFLLFLAQRPILSNPRELLFSRPRCAVQRRSLSNPCNAHPLRSLVHVPRGDRSRIGVTCSFTPPTPLSLSLSDECVRHSLHGGFCEKSERIISFSLVPFFPSDERVHHSHDEFHEKRQRTVRPSLFLFDECPRHANVRGKSQRTYLHLPAKSLLAAARNSSFLLSLSFLDHRGWLESLDPTIDRADPLNQVRYDDLTRLALESRATQFFFFFSCPKIAVFSQFEVYLSITQAATNNKFILSSDIVPTSSKRKRRNYCIRLLSLVMVRNQLLAQGVK